MDVIKTLYRFSCNELNASHKRSYSHLIIAYNAPQNKDGIVAQSMDNARDVTYVPGLQPACPSSPGVCFSFILKSS